MEDNYQGKWSLMLYLYKGHSLYCMSYKRKEDSEDDRKKDRKTDGDEEKEEDSEKKDDERHPGVSLTKKPRTLRRRDISVSVVEFKSMTPNLLASGADDGEIRFWDLAKPSHFPLLKGIGSATQGKISSISWNRKVQQVSASTSYDGTTVIWNLRKQKPTINFADSVRHQWSVLQWNPDISTQIMDDDSSATLKLWDMRNIMSPVSEFIGHQKGVIAMEWCPSDSSYLLTCAKDNRTICWDTNTVEIVSELSAGNNWNFDVRWYPKIPGVISALSFDGKVGIYNIEFAQGEERMILCDAPASKLMAAVLCYICAGNVELLQDLMEKTLVLALATGNERFSTSLFEIYAEILAMKYLKAVDSGGLSPELSILETNTAASSNTQPQSTMPYNQTASGNAQPQSTLPYNQEPSQAQPNVLGNSYVPATSHPPMQLQPTMLIPQQAPQQSFPPAPNNAYIAAHSAEAEDSLK